MLNGIPQTAGKIAVGVAGVTILAASANTVAILVESVRRASVQANDYFFGQDNSINSIDNSWGMRVLFPYRRTQDWKQLGLAALMNVVTGTAALYLANRYCPALVTNANSLLNHVVPIQFTPDNIPLAKFFGL